MINKFESVKEKIIRFKNQKDCQNLPNYSILKNRDTQDLYRINRNRLFDFND